MRLSAKYIQKVTVILLVALLLSCEQDTTVNLGTPDLILVIEGRIELLENVTNHQHEFVLSTLGGYFDNQQTPRATDAIVWVTNSRGDRHNFEEVEVGVYRNNDLVPEVGEQYSLHIIWGNEEYEATESLLAAPAIEAIYQEYVEANLFDDAGLQIAIDFTDPEGEENYYFWETFLDGKLQTVASPGNKDNLLSSDEFFNGSTINGYFPNEEVIFQPGDEAMVKQVALSKNGYDYYFALFDQSAKTGALVDTPPIPVRGNIRNLTNPDNYALGYFLASQTSVGIHTIE